MEPARTGDRFLRKADVTARTSLSPSSIYRREREGRFPRRIRLTPRCTVWRESEINQWLANPAGYQPDDGRPSFSGDMGA